MTYAGRLDPMASGLLIILTREETKKKEKYLKLNKEYEFEVLFGFSTDTHDILGEVLNSKNILVSRDDIKKDLKNFIGENIQKYPIYSSKTVKGKPLFTYARSGEEVEIPERKIFIKKLKLIKIKQMNDKKLSQNIEKRIKKVKGDFRQEGILKIWKKKLKGNDARYTIASFKVSCSSGTYVRVIANSLGDKLKVPSLAYSIRRTKVGNYVI